MKRFAVVLCATAVLLLGGQAAHAITIAPAQVTAGPDTLNITAATGNFACDVTLILNILNPIALTLPKTAGWVEPIFANCQNGFTVTPGLEALLNGNAGWPLTLTRLLGTLPNNILGARFMMNVGFAIKRFGIVVCTLSGEIEYLIAQGEHKKDILANTLAACGGVAGSLGSNQAMDLSANVAIA